MAGDWRPTGLCVCVCCGVALGESSCEGTCHARSADYVIHGQEHPEESCGSGRGRDGAKYKAMRLREPCQGEGGNDTRNFSLPATSDGAAFSHTQGEKKKPCAAQIPSNRGRAVTRDRVRTLEGGSEKGSNE